MENAMMRIASRVLRDARRQWRRLIRDDKGSIIALAIWLPVLAGAVAIGVQTGELYRVKRQMQSAADAGALAGAVDSIAGRTTAITTDAQYEAQRNGFTNNGGTVTVTVNTPPSSGPNIGLPTPSRSSSRSRLASASVRRSSARPTASG
jgi:Flp pilus assembly protein TadG